MTFKRALLGSGLAAVMLLAAACAGGSGEKAMQGGSDRAAYTGMLRAIPDTPETRQSVTINNYARMRERFRLAAPGPNADAESLQAYIGALLGAHYTGQPTFVSGMGPVPGAPTPMRRSNVGYGPQDVDLDILAGVPPARFEAAKGRFDPKATDRALAECIACPSEARGRYTRETYRDVIIHGWGDGLQISLQTRLAPPVFDQFGRAQALAVEQDRVFRYPATDPIKLMIDLSAGREVVSEGFKISSLAANSEFSLMAKTMGDMGVYSLF